MSRLPQFRAPLGRPSRIHLSRLTFTPENLRTESEQCARERKAYFRKLAKDPAAYQNFLNRAGGVPVESK